MLSNPFKNVQQKKKKEKKYGMCILILSQLTLEVVEV